MGLMQIKGHAKRADVLKVKSQLAHARTDISKLTKMMKHHLRQPSQTQIRHLLVNLAKSGNIVKSEKTIVHVEIREM